MIYSSQYREDTLTKKQNKTDLAFPYWIFLIDNYTAVVVG